MKSMEAMVFLGNAVLDDSVEYTKEELVELRNASYCALNIPGYLSFLRSKTVGYTDEEVVSIVESAPTVLFGTINTLKMLKTRH